VGLRARDQLPFPGREPVAIDAGFERDQHDPLLLAKREGADRLAHIPGLVLARAWIEAVQQALVEIDPEQALAALAPDRAFAELGADVENAVDRRLRHR